MLKKLIGSKPLTCFLCVWWGKFPYKEFFKQEYFWVSVSKEQTKKWVYTCPCLVSVPSLLPQVASLPEDLGMPHLGVSLAILSLSFPTPHLELFPRIFVPSTLIYVTTISNHDIKNWSNYRSILDKLWFIYIIQYYIAIKNHISEIYLIAHKKANNKDRKKFYIAISFCIYLETLTKAIFWWFSCNNKLGEKS